jgi:hypothetical protein
MRPFVLAGIIVALAGCSLPYEGTHFAAMPKFESAAEGGHHEVADPSSDNERSGAVHMEAHGSGQGGNLYATDRDDNFPDVPSNHWAYEATESKKLGQTPVAFPVTAQPTGKVTMNPTENRSAPQPQAASEGSEHHGE